MDMGGGIDFVEEGDVGDFMVRVCLECQPLYSNLWAVVVEPTLS